MTKDTAISILTINLVSAIGMTYQLDSFSLQEQIEIISEAMEAAKAEKAGRNAQ